MQLVVHDSDKILAGREEKQAAAGRNSPGLKNKETLHVCGLRTS